MENVPKVLRGRGTAGRRQDLDRKSIRRAPTSQSLGTVGKVSHPQTGGRRAGFANEIPCRRAAHSGSRDLFNRLIHRYDPQTLTLTFIVADVPGDNNDIEAQGGLAAVLHEAVSDPSRSRMDVVYNGAKPDLLRHEAQAIMTGHLGPDGTFYADELLLKCPTKYEEAVPEQVGSY